MNRTTRTALFSAVLVLSSGCAQDAGPGHKTWVASARQEDRIDRAIAAESWLGLTKPQLEQALRAQIFSNQTVDFTYRRPDTDLFQARFDEALVIHRPLRSDDVWILLRDGKVAHVAPVFIE